MPRKQQNRALKNTHLDKTAPGQFLLCVKSSLFQGSRCRHQLCNLAKKRGEENDGNVGLSMVTAQVGYLNAARELRIEKTYIKKKTLLVGNQNLLLWQIQRFVLFAEGLAFKYERSARDNSWTSFFKWVLWAVNKKPCCCAMPWGSSCVDTGRCWSGGGRGRVVICVFKFGCLTVVVLHTFFYFT